MGKYINLKHHWSFYIPMILGEVAILNWGIYGGSRLLGQPFDLVTWLGNSINMPTLSNILFVGLGIMGIWYIVEAVAGHIRK